MQQFKLNIFLFESCSNLNRNRINSDLSIIEANIYKRRSLFDTYRNLEKKNQILEEKFLKDVRLNNFFHHQPERLPPLDMLGTILPRCLGFNICCPRDCVSRHNGGTSGAPLKPLRDDSVLRYYVPRGASLLDSGLSFFFQSDVIDWNFFVLMF